MAVYSAEAFLEKLAKLTTTQQSIETLSQWCIWHKKSSKNIVDTWGQGLSKAEDARCAARATHAHTPRLLLLVAL